MSQHNCYHEVSAGTHYDLGLQLGKLFGETIRNFLPELSGLTAKQKELSRACYEETEKRFPHYIEELKGYAAGAEIDMADFWLASLEGDLEKLEKCTTIVTNDGRLIGHNEDWERYAGNRLYILKKTLKQNTTFELHYAGTLGGNSVSINSHGVIQTINSLPAAPVSQPGPYIPSNVAGRWLSDSSDIEADIAALKESRLLAGYSHTLIDKNGGRGWSVESSQNMVFAKKVETPFTHTNHYLAPDLAHLNKYHTYGSTGSHARMKAISDGARPQMSLAETQTLLEDHSNGPEESIKNKKTIGSIVLDLDNDTAWIWLLREDDKGWVSYDIAL